MQGFGLRKDGADIDYRERSPLVLPPQPQSAAAAGGRRRRQAPQLAGRSRGQAPQEAQEPRASDDVNDPRRRRRSRCRRTECRPAGSAAAAPATRRQDHPKARRSRMRPAELGYKGGLFGILFWAQQGRNVDVHRRAPRTQPDRAAGRLQTPSPNAALRHRRKTGSRRKPSDHSPTNSDAASTDGSDRPAAVDHPVVASPCRDVDVRRRSRADTATTVSRPHCPIERAIRATAADFAIAAGLRCRRGVCRTRCAERRPVRTSAISRSRTVSRSSSSPTGARRSSPT